LPPASEEFYRDEHLFVDLRQQVVMLDSEVVTLTRMEYQLLALLVKRAEEVVPRSISPKADRTVGCAPVAAAEKTREIRQPVHRNGHRHWIPFPAFLPRN
jgi:hypothetical protein